MCRHVTYLWSENQKREREEKKRVDFLWALRVIRANEFYMGDYNASETRKISPVPAPTHSRATKFYRKIVRYEYDF